MTTTRTQPEVTTQTLELDQPEELVWNEHRNDLDDYCPWSGKVVPADHEVELLEEDRRCPAVCRRSRVEEAG